MIHCIVTVSVRPSASAGSSAKTARRHSGLKPLVLRGERLVSFATTPASDGDKKFWGKDLSPDQLKFLERKEKAARGEGPLLPAESQCPRCSGGGQCVCTNCKGTGLNPKDKDMGGRAGVMLADNEMGRENELSGQVAAEPALLSFSNKAEPWRFQEGMPCWVCLGKRVILCGDCAGRGFGANSMAYGGD